MGSERSLKYHAEPRPGKISISLTKAMNTMEDLTLAYTPGVADVCRAIAADPNDACRYTNKGQTVAVVTNGTAVLGLGNIGPLAGKPVMEGKAALFKRFGGVSAVDVCVDETDPQKLIDIVRAISPTYGGINLEDIRAPECFIVEQSLRNCLDIPVFHDDQHGTAVCVVAALQRAAAVQGHNFEEMRFVFSGAGASALATATLLCTFGVPRENILLVDSAGVIYDGRVQNMHEYKAPFAVQTSARTLSDAMQGAHAVIGLSSAGLISQAMVKRAVVPDAIALTGRSDDPNQVNNVLCFPFLFRGALDVCATDVSPCMREAAARALARVAEMEGALVPNIFSKNLLPEIAGSVAQAAQDAGFAKKTLNIAQYKEKLQQEVA